MKKQEEEKETPKAHAAYLEYCQMGPSRSLRKLAEKLGQTEGKPGARLATLEEWSSKHDWQNRVKEHDRELFKAHETQAINKLLAYLDAEVEVTAATQIKAAQILLEYTERHGKLAELEEELALTKAALEQAGISVGSSQLAR